VICQTSTFSYFKEKCLFFSHQWLLKRSLIMQATAYLIQPQYLHCRLLKSYEHILENIWRNIVQMIKMNNFSSNNIPSTPQFLRKCVLMMSSAQVLKSEAEWNNIHVSQNARGWFLSENRKHMYRMWQINFSLVDVVLTRLSFLKFSPLWQPV
jgi:hypothetical protein